MDHTSLPIYVTHCVQPECVFADTNRLREGYTDVNRVLVVTFPFVLGVVARMLKNGASVQQILSFG